ncbi:MAG TPA: SDR family oxidoreductase [Burkholderiaceae bacterium]|nr:SDR family oxidoreductase [Burkholderiaceae bacterium]
MSRTAPRVALVTGSTSGIGRAIAERLCSDGFEVAFHSRASVALGQELAAGHPGASYTQADLADEAQTRRLAAEVLQRHGRLDVLVNNAGISGRIPHDDMRAASPEVWRRLYDVNVIAPWLLITELRDALADSARTGRPGCVLNVSSHAGVRPRGASIPYASSKAALNHMTRLLAVSLAPDIRVNAIAPGLVDTPLTREWTTMQALWRERAPMGRAASPEDIAELASMMIASGYLTGEILMADGGYNLT